MRRRFGLAVLSWSLTACSFAVDFDGYEAAPDAGGARPRDAGNPPDAAAPVDASTADAGADPDAGTATPDAGFDPDAGFADSGIIEVRSSTIALGAATVCAKTETDVVCWGRNWSGEAGNCALTTGDDGLPPTTVANLLTNVDTVVSGDRASCVLDELGEAFCFGRSQHRTFNDPLGDITCTARALTRGLERFVELDIGAFHACGRDPTNEMFCWGLDDAGQVGDGEIGSATGIAGPTVLPAPASAIAQIDLGFRTSCARTDAGEIYCWGANPGNWMNLAAPLENVATPTVSTAAPPNLTSFEVSRLPNEIFACGISNDELRCWGNWTDCPLPVGDSRRFLLPAGVPVQVAVGSRHVCARNDLGNVYCFGFNGSYQLGSMAPPTCQPSLVVGLQGAMLQVLAGDDFVCTVDTDAVVWCWGANRYAQIGEDPTTGPRRFATPRRIYRSVP